ncbi:MAG: hypothetical protein IJV09_03825 [Prevotella sp.]|nr:hypothetical protein [Prevotella sp.]
MKKTYIVPEMDVVNIELPAIMAGSPNGVLDTGSPTEPAYGRFFDDEFDLPQE